MNSKDPFNLRRNSSALQLLRNGVYTVQQQASQASQLLVTAVRTTDDPGLAKKRDDPQFSSGSTSAAMSYALPQNGPTHRHPDGWSKAGEGGQGNGGISEKMSTMFGSDRRDSLPMYKDKPAGHSSKRKAQFRSKTAVAAVLGTLAGVSWWFGFLSPLSYASGGTGASSVKAGSSWSLLGSAKSSAVDWNGRADKVRDAFKISWAGYEKYAWGMSPPA